MKGKKRKKKSDRIDSMVCFKDGSTELHRAIFYAVEGNITEARDAVKRISDAIEHILKYPERYEL